MFKLVVSCTILVLVCLSNSFGQALVDVSKPRLKIQGDNLIITYDILKSKPGEKFRVWIEVTDSRGFVLNAKTFKGDIGQSVLGGSNKEIIWDFKADNINTDDEIFVQVFAEPIIEQIEKKPQTEPVQPVKSVSHGGAILYSVMFPGWGLSRMHKGKPHWIKGVLGYGCIAGSVYYNKAANSNYSNYLNSFDIQESDTYFNNAAQQEKLSRIFAYTAIGIWVSDIVWVVFDNSNSRKQERSQVKPYSIQTDFNAQMNMPVLTFTYNF